MTKAAICLLSLLISLPPSAAALAQGGVDSGGHSAKSRKAYLKHEKKLQKNAQKEQKKAVKKWKKQHDIS